MPREPHVCDAQDPSSGRPATFIFLHGYGDDAQGLPLGVAQQFQFNSKLPYLKWLLPNAPHNMDAMGQAWYVIKELPNPLKPRVPGREEEELSNEDDEEGIMKSVAAIDALVKQEIDHGVAPGRIVVGGFSQGCAVSLVWGLLGQLRNEVGGIVGMSGYFPLAGRIPELKRESHVEEGSENGQKKWLYVHGSKDMLVPTSLFNAGKKKLLKYVQKEDLEEHLYEGMGHSTGSAELRDLLKWLNMVVPP